MHASETSDWPMVHVDDVRALLAAFTAHPQLMLVQVDELYNAHLVDLHQLFPAATDDDDDAVCQVQLVHAWDAAEKTPKQEWHLRRREQPDGDYTCVTCSWEGIVLIKVLPGDDQ